MYKELTKEEKIKLFLDFFNNEEEVDTVIALNVFLLIKGNNSFTDDFFSNESVIFNSTMEFIDIKDAIKKELDNYVNNLLGIYLSCFMHCTTHDEKVTKTIFDRYKKVLFLLDFQTIGKLFKKYTPCGQEVLYADNYEIVYSFCRQFDMYIRLLEEDNISHGDQS